MADTPPTGRARWLWIIILLALLVVLVVWLLDPAGDADETVPAAPQVEATGFVVEPTGPAVPVEVPTTPMTNAPATPAE